MGIGPGGSLTSPGSGERVLPTWTVLPLMVTTCKRRLPDPMAVFAGLRSPAITGRFRLGRREGDDFRGRAWVTAAHSVSNLLTDQHHDQAAPKHNRASEHGDLIISELSGKQHGSQAPITSEAGRQQRHHAENGPIPSRRSRPKSCSVSSDIPAGLQSATQNRLDHDQTAVESRHGQLLSHGSSLPIVSILSCPTTRHPACRGGSLAICATTLPELLGSAKAREPKEQAQWRDFCR